MKSVGTRTILAIDTSCDETSVAVTKGHVILSNIIYSQLDLHREFGGVVPSIAQIEHEKKLPVVLERALHLAGVSWKQVDAIAVTVGPGLAIALEIGLGKAKDLALKWRKPLIAVNHMEGHLLSVLAQPRHGSDKVGKVAFPVLGLLVSGGHTEFIWARGIGEYQKIGQTLDDACGEAFDKSARILGLGYPGGPKVSRLAKENRAKLKLVFAKENTGLFVRGYKLGKSGTLSTEADYELPVPLANSPELDVSYSGLKSAFKRLVSRLVTGEMVSPKGVEELAEGLTPEQRADLATMFEAAAYKVLTVKLELALRQWGAREIWLGGGVSASARLRSEVRKVARAHNLTFRIPYSRRLMTDNAAMIGVAAGLNPEKVYDWKNLVGLDRDAILDLGD